MRLTCVLAFTPGIISRLRSITVSCKQANKLYYLCTCNRQIDQLPCSELLHLREGRMIQRHNCALGNPVPSNIGIRRRNNPRDTVLLIQSL